VLDKEKDGIITVKELKYFMRKVAHIKLSSEEAEAMIEFASTDKERRGVTFEDFERIVDIAVSNSNNNSRHGREDIEDEF